MKKSLSILISVLLVFTLAACQNQQNNTKGQNTSSDNSEISDNGTTVKAFTVYRTLSEFGDGFAWVSGYDNYDGGKNKTACIDSNGNIQFFLNDIIEAEKLYDNSVQDFESGFSAVTLDDASYVVNTKGEVILSSDTESFDSIAAYGGGYFAVEKYENDYHDAQYTVSIIDSNGKTVADRWIESNDEINIVYVGNGVFCYLARTANSNENNDYKYFSAKAGKAFEIKGCSNMCQFNCDKALVHPYMKDYREIIYTDGTSKKVNINSNYVTDIFEDMFIYKKSEDQSLYLYDTLTDKSTILYSCGEGSRAEFKAYDNGNFLIEIKGNNNSNFNDCWFAAVDKSSKALFEPIKESSSGAKGMSISCDRIVVGKEVFDLEGNAIQLPEGYEISANNGYKDNLIMVEHKTDSNSYISDNYIDIAGNLLFTEDINY